MRLWCRGQGTLALPGLSGGLGPCRLSSGRRSGPAVMARLPDQTGTRVRPVPVARPEAVTTSCDMRVGHSMPGGIIVNFEAEVASISLGAFRTLSLLNFEELGKGFAVLVTIGEGLRRNDVVNRGDVD